MDSTVEWLNKQTAFIKPLTTRKQKSHTRASIWNLGKQTDMEVFDEKSRFIYRRYTCPHCSRCWRNIPSRICVAHTGGCTSQLSKHVPISHVQNNSLIHNPSPVSNSSASITEDEDPMEDDPQADV